MGMQEKLSANRSKVHFIRIQDIRWKETTPTPAEILACQIHESSICIGPSSLHELHVQVPSGNEWLKRLPLLATMTCAPLPHRNTSLPPPSCGLQSKNFNHCGSSEKKLLGPAEPLQQGGWQHLPEQLLAGPHKVQGTQSSSLPSVSSGSPQSTQVPHAPNKSPQFP